MKSKHYIKINIKVENYGGLHKDFILFRKKKRAKECQKLAQDELHRKADRIRDKKIRKDYLELPPLHKQIFMKIDDAVILHNTQQSIHSEVKNNKLNAYKFCPNCGFNNKPLFKFCPECGTPLLIN